MIALIVPCYNEEKRLHIETFIQHNDMGIDFFFVDDGSKDRTAEIIEQASQKHGFIHLVRMDKNGGKAKAVRHGMLEAYQKLQWDDRSWIGFWDADLATPLSEIPKMLQYSNLYENVDSIWCSRVYRLGADVKRSPLRHYLGRGFATLVGELLHVKSYDTQCGAKLFRPSIVPVAFKETFIGKWVFDVEILLRLKNHTVVEYPVTEWRDVPGSKVKISREIFRVFWEILKIRKKYIK
ncbi:glycosyltransferase [Bdellovibrio sp. HCB185ZH]|uniref:glycosyltransferase n=1 Tax=Bdellovibrio sp. HCB185ZH TaxID=3394235 RepID=UPI0039A63DBC